MPLTPAARFLTDRARKPRVKEKLYMVTVDKGEDPVPIVATGFKCDLSGNLMMYHYGTLMVFKEWRLLKQVDFDNPVEPELDPADASAGTEPA
jgi:hypothetical protein